MSSRQPAEWNAAVYHQVSNPHVVWGRTVLSDLTLRGDETVLDAGCGSGRLTAELLDLLPDGHVFAVDRSANMLVEAKSNLARFGDRVTFVQADIGTIDPATIGIPVDLVFSTATFHWILDHDGLFRSIYRLLKPGGVLSAQCGGGPNLEQLLLRARTLMESEDFAEYFTGWAGPWEFASDITTAERLERVGFTDITTWLYDAPTPMGDIESYRSFLTNVIMGEHLARLPEARRSVFIDTLTERAADDDPPWSFDYWRLNIRARRPADS